MKVNAARIVVRGRIRCGGVCMLFLAVLFWNAVVLCKRGAWPGGGRVGRSALLFYRHFSGKLRLVQVQSLK